MAGSEFVQWVAEFRDKRRAAEEQAAFAREQQEAVRQRSLQLDAERKEAAKRMEVKPKKFKVVVSMQREPLTQAEIDTRRAERVARRAENPPKRVKRR